MERSECLGRRCVLVGSMLNSCGEGLILRLLPGGAAPFSRADSLLSFVTSLTHFDDTLIWGFDKSSAALPPHCTRLPLLSVEAWDRLAPGKTNRAFKYVPYGPCVLPGWGL